MAQSRASVPVGFIYSLSGPYAAIGQAALAGALHAVDEINADDSFPFRLDAQIRDPGGDNAVYAREADTLLRQDGCKHIAGTITSSGRKDVIPVAERAGALLWYAFPYEGYETCSQVIYLGACANQHIVPMLDYVMPAFGKRPYLIGSNYIWGWEVNRIARQLVEAAGGAPVAERYLPLGDVDAGHLLADIREKRPDFILSNLIGPSSYAFVAAYAALGRSDPAFAPDRCPIVSCNLSEADTAEIGPAAEGILSAAVWFDTLDTPAAQLFRQKALARRGAGSRHLSQCYAAPFSAVRILAESIRRAGTDDPAAVRSAATASPFETPFGPVLIDGRTGHSHLRPYLGRVRADGMFAIIHSAREPIRPDPYLVHQAPAANQPAPGPVYPAKLRVVN